MVILHIDANSAYLSWTAAAMLKEGATVDLREIPAVVGGDEESRHGIVLAKSPACKALGIVTGESLFEARRKCRDLVVVPPDHELYRRCSDAMYRLLCEYSPVIQRFSIDECFLDYTASARRFGDPVKIAHEIRERIKKELGFTVNVGVAENKILAKMASEFEKPDKVHTLWKTEIQTKMWPLPVRELFMVGKAAEQKLKKVNINTIGDLAAADPVYIRTLLKAHGTLLHEYANGIDTTPVVPDSETERKGIGNSTTTAADVTDRLEAHKILLSLTERVGMRLRAAGKKTTLVSVTLKTSSFVTSSRQCKLAAPIDETSGIYRQVVELFDQCWKGEPLRLLGVTVSDFDKEEEAQLSLFDNPKENEKKGEIDKVVDQIRQKYGDSAIMRGTFANGSVPPLTGGTRED